MFKMEKKQITSLRKCVFKDWETIEKLSQYVLRRYWTVLHIAHERNAALKKFDSNFK